MVSKRNRQRKLERARVQRRMVRQADRVRRNRQLQAGVGAALVLSLVVLGTVWLLGGFDAKPAEKAAEGPSCSWTERSISDPTVVDVGEPPKTGQRRSGVETMTIKTNRGDIKVELDLSKVPCTAASFAYLGEENFFADSTCHRLNTTLKTLSCGDPLSDGAGSPSYQFADEYLPTTPLSAPTPTSTAATPSPTSTGPAQYYAKGTVVLVNTGANTNGSQFMIVYGDGSTLAPAYSIVGRVVSGMQVVEGVAKGGAVDKDGKPTDEGTPKVKLTIKQLYVGAPASPTTPAPTATPSASQPASAGPTPTS